MTDTGQPPRNKLVRVQDEYILRLKSVNKERAKRQEPPLIASWLAEDGGIRQALEAEEARLGIKPKEIANG